jgi:DNA-binding NtrC family response regulator
MSRQTVLIVDDEKNIRLTLSETIKSMKLAAETAVNGEEALSKIKQQSVHLVLLDYKLPGMDGLEVLQRVRATHPDLPVVFITAHGTVESAVEAMKLGAVDFLQKPFAPQEIREVVSAALRRHEARRQSSRDYDDWLRLARACIEEGDWRAASEHLKNAIASAPGRPQAFNLLGAVEESERHIDVALKYYRTAYNLEPTYRPAGRNIERLTKVQLEPGRIDLDEEG